MDQAVRALVLLLVAGVAITGLAAAVVWWMEPSRRIGRLLSRLLEGALDAVVTAPARGQGAGIRFDARRIAVVQNFTDGGLVFELHELVGAELIFDGQVAARAFRGESRRPLDRIDPEVGRVILRLVFDDVRDPDFDLELWNADDPYRQGWDGPAAVQAARRFFARVEALVRK
jgi:HAMP domain-containing protein